MRFLEVIRRKHPPEAYHQVGPSEGRSLLVIIERLMPSVVGQREIGILYRLREEIAARLGEHRLERHYVGHERCGYRTYVRTERDVAWLRLRVALLAEAAGLRQGTVRVRLGMEGEGQDGTLPDLSGEHAMPAISQA
jgi:hypothetical protein